MVYYRRVNIVLLIYSGSLLFISSIYNSLHCFTHLCLWTSCRYFSEQLHWRKPTQANGCIYHDKNSVTFSRAPLGIKVEMSWVAIWWDLSCFSLFLEDPISWCGKGQGTGHKECWCFETLFSTKLRPYSSTSNASLRRNIKSWEKVARER